MAPILRPARQKRPMALQPFAAMAGSTALLALLASSVSAVQQPSGVRVEPAPSRRREVSGSDYSRYLQGVVVATPENGCRTVLEVSHSDVGNHAGSKGVQDSLPPSLQSRQQSLDPASASWPKGRSSQDQGQAHPGCGSFERSKLGHSGGTLSSLPRSYGSDSRANQSEGDKRDVAAYRPL